MKQNILLLAICQAILTSAASLAGTSAALVANILTENKEWATLPISIIFLSTMLVTFPASLLMRRVGRSAGFSIGAICGLLGACLAATAIHEKSFSLFCLSAVGLGSFTAFGQFYRFAAADIATPDYQSRAIAFVLSGGVAGAFVGPNLAALTRDAWDTTFAATFASLAGLYFLSFILSRFLDMQKSKVTVAVEEERPLKQLTRQPTFIVAMLSAMIGYGIMSLIMTATPLAMHFHQHAFADTALVIQWHVVAMFAPSFATGHLIKRFSALNIILTGIIVNIACVAINLNGTEMTHFVVALVALGIGWNFMFIGGTTLLTETYHDSEKAKAQGLNDFLIFATVTAVSLSSGALLHLWGWRGVNWAAVPLIMLTLIIVTWFKLAGKNQNRLKVLNTQPQT